MHRGRGRPAIPFEERHSVEFKAKLRPREARRLKALGSRLGLAQAALVREALYRLIEQESQGSPAVGVSVADR